MKTSSNQLPAINPALLNIVTPMGLEFQRTQLTLGEFTAKVYGVSKYPPSVEMGWLSKVSHLPGTVISQLFVPVDNTLLVEAISRNIQQNRATAESTRDPLTQKRAEKGAEDGERILTQIDQYGETVGYMTCDASCSELRQCRFRNFLAMVMNPAINIQVCNHHYLLADLYHRQTGKVPLLPNYRAVIIDEAHRLPDTAKQMNILVDVHPEKQKTARSVSRPGDRVQYAEIHTGLEIEC